MIKAEVSLNLKTLQFLTEVLSHVPYLHPCLDGDWETMSGLLHDELGAEFEDTNWDEMLTQRLTKLWNEEFA